MRAGNGAQSAGCLAADGVGLTMEAKSGFELSGEVGRVINRGESSEIPVAGLPSETNLDIFP